VFRKIKSNYLNYTRKLREAVREKKPLKIIKELVEAKANVNHPSRLPPLYELIRYGGDASCVKYLLEQKADINWKNGDGGMLHLSLSWHFIEVTKILLENNANSNSVNNNGDTPLHLAARGYHENDQKIVNLLLEYNASPSILNKKLVSPYRIACDNFYDIETKRSTKSIMFSLSKEGIKYREDMKKYNEELRVSELTPLTQQFFEEVLGFPRDIILNILFLYLLPQKPKHPMPEILMSDETGNHDKESVELLLVEKKADLPLVNNDNKMVAKLELEKSRAHMHRFLTALSKKNSDAQRVVTEDQRRALFDPFR
jgi:hypothetical protein